MKCARLEILPPLCEPSDSDLCGHTGWGFEVLESFIPVGGKPETNKPATLVHT